MRSDDHDISFEIRVYTFDKTEDVLSLERLPVDVDCNRGLDLTLRGPQVGNEVSGNK